MIYDVTNLSVGVGKTPLALETIGKALQGVTSSTLYACWYCEIGAVGDIMLLRGYATPAALHEDREQMAMQGDPFGLGETLESLTTSAYLQFPFLPDLVTGKLGPFYEVRIYQTTRPGLAKTIDLWREAIPHRIKISPLATAMYAIDGPIPRIMHVWPFPTLDARQSLRQKAFDSGQWPPKGGLAHLRRFSSSIYLPAAFSPLA